VALLQSGKDLNDSEPTVAKDEERLLSSAGIAKQIHASGLF
jgi:hypothetical protein